MLAIVGAGEAGTRAALALRELGWGGGISLLGDEDHLPYERPPLSKQILLAEAGAAIAPIASQERLDDLRIRFVPGRKVASLDCSSHSLHCNDGSVIQYERLLIATGASPRRLSVPGLSSERPRYLRSLDDARHIRENLVKGCRVTIVGGGYIGLEVAAAAVVHGCQVTVIEAGPRVLSRGVPEPIGETLARVHHGAGVKFHVGVSVVSANAHGEEHHLTLSSGDTVAFDCLIAGVGAVPETALATAAGLAVDNGVLVDAMLATSEPDVFAAGDCCSFPHPVLGGQRMRLESWYNAMDQAAVAAANMLGQSIAYSAIPRFWSDQYELTVQVVGFPAVPSTLVHRPMGDAGDLYFQVASDGRLVASSSIGPTGKLARDIRLAQKLIEQAVRPEPRSLASRDVQLKSLLTA